jgi:hypothetical protein
LRVNYRTSHQIGTLADHLLGPVVTDVDGKFLEGLPIAQRRNPTYVCYAQVEMREPVR